MNTKEKIEFCQKQIAFLRKQMGKHNTVYPDSSFAEAIVYWQNQIIKATK